MSLAFAIVTEITLMTLGGGLKRKESISGRLGDVLSYLYLGSAVLKHHYDNGSPDDELPLLEWACRDLLYNIQTRLYEVLNNLPNRMLARFARVLTFPLGKPYQRPDDALSQRVADILMHPGNLRDRLTEGVYIPDDDNEPVAQLETALQKAAIAEPLLLKLRVAMKQGEIARGDPETCIDAGLAAGVITEVEANAIRAAIAARKIVIQVDEFEPDYFTKEQSTWGDSKLDGVAGQSM